MGLFCLHFILFPKGEVSGRVGPYSVQLVPSTGMCMTLARKASSIYFRVRISSISVFSVFVRHCVVFIRNVDYRSRSLCIATLS